MAREKEDSEMMWHQHRRRMGVFRLLLGFLLLVLGLVWLGNDWGWWNLNIPWGPLIVVLLGIGLILGSILRFMRA